MDHDTARDLAALILMIAMLTSIAAYLYAMAALSVRLPGGPSPWVLAGAIVASGAWASACYWYWRIRLRRRP